MIMTLSGVLTHKTEQMVIVEVQGVGYAVRVPATALALLHVGATVRLWTHEYVREDAHELFGFQNFGEHRLFLKLISVSGVGPKTALAMLSLGTSDEIEKKIEQADVSWLCSVPGIGKKTAQKIVLDLKGKLVDGETVGSQTEEVMSALINLGYSREKAKEVLSRVHDTQNVEDRLRSALRELAK